MMMHIKQLCHGDVAQLTNASGTVTKYYTYDSFDVETGNLYVYGFNNPVRYADYSGNDVYVVGGYLAAEMGIHLELSPGFCWDDNGDWSLMDTGSVGQGWLSATAGGYYTRIFAESIDVLGGASLEITGSALFASGSYTTTAKDANGKSYSGFTVVASRDPSLPVSQSVTVSYSAVYNMTKIGGILGRAANDWYEELINKAIIATLMKNNIK